MYYEPVGSRPSPAASEQPERIAESAVGFPGCYAGQVHYVMLFLPSSPFLVWLSFGDWLMAVERGGSGVRTSLFRWFQEGMELSRSSDSAVNSRGGLAGRWGRSAVLILLRA